MSAHTKITAANVQAKDARATEPTLDEKLRYIDIFVDAPSIARKALIEAGTIAPHSIGFPSDERRHPEDVIRGKIIGDRAAIIVAEKVFLEGLNPEVMTTDRVRAAYANLMSPIGTPAESYVPALGGVS